MNEFIYNLDDISKELASRKDNLKKYLNRTGFVCGIDYVQHRCHDPNRKKNLGGFNKETILLSTKCYNQLCLHYAQYSKKTIALQDININYIKRFLPKETEILGFLYEVLLPICQVERQYKVLSYFIDLYIPEYKLAIECDEYNHKHYDRDKDINRQEIIEKKLKCQFIRFNPDDADFKLLILTSNILQVIILNNLNNKK